MLACMELKTGLYIDGSWVTGDGTLDVIDPSTGAVIAAVSTAGDGECDAAVTAAHNAFPEWAKSAPRYRAEILRKAFELMVAEADYLATLISKENGKVFSDAKGEVVRGLEVVEFACGAPHLLKTSHTDNVGGGIDNWHLRQPLGVCAGITPFNFLSWCRYG